MLVKFEQNHIVLTTRNFKFFDEKAVFFTNIFWRKVDAILEDISAAKTIV